MNILLFGLLWIGLAGAMEKKEEATVQLFKQNPFGKKLIHAGKLHYDVLAPTVDPLHDETTSVHFSVEEDQSSYDYIKNLRSMLAHSTREEIAQQHAYLDRPFVIMSDFTFKGGKGKTAVYNLANRKRYAEDFGVVYGGSTPTAESEPGQAMRKADMEAKECYFFPENKSVKLSVVCNNGQEESFYVYNPYVSGVSAKRGIFYKLSFVKRYSDGTNSEVTWSFIPNIFSSAYATCKKNEQDTPCILRLKN